jgi:hypothetical protein
MAEFQWMYKMTKALDDKNSVMANDNDMIGFADESGEDYILLENEIDFLNGFMDSHKLSRSHRQKIYASAKARGYIQLIPIHIDQLQDKLKVTAKGNDFLFKRWFIPTGFLRAVLEDNKQLLSLLGLISAIVVCIATVVNVIILANTK